MTIVLGAHAGADVDADAAVAELSAIPSPATQAARRNLRIRPPCFEEMPREQEKQAPQADIPSLVIFGLYDPDAALSSMNRIQQGKSRERRWRNPAPGVVGP